MRGGLFVCRTPEEALAARLPDESALLVAPRALLKVMVWGASRQIGGPRSGTLVYASLRPVQAYPLGIGYRCAWVAPRALTSISLQQARRRLPPFHGPQHTEAVPNFRQRAAMGELTKEIMGMEAKITRATRAQLGW